MPSTSTVPSLSLLTSKPQITERANDSVIACRSSAASLMAR